MSEKKLELVLMWHMHQPDYRDYETKEFTLPWVYLHAIKDYTDMAWHLEKHTDINAVVNFVPILLDQLEDYAQQFSVGKVRDPLLNLLSSENLDKITHEQRMFIINSCFHSNHLTMITPFPAYKRLHDIYVMLNKDNEIGFDYLSSQYLADLITWYHLAWTGETVRREHEIVVNLMTKGESFSFDDRMQLFNLIGELIQNLIPRYKKLSENGRVEISTTPHYHPMAPLLLDLAVMREAEPLALLPEARSYPGGRERVQFHIDSAIESHQQRFASKPSGFWPAEGAISDDLLQQFAESNVTWTASGEGVLHNSLRREPHSGPLSTRNRYLYRPYHVKNLTGISCFFRDERLSDLIGFEYARWHGKDAANHFIAELENIWHDTPNEENPVVSIILDGENAWEYYPYNGFYFFNDVYGLLSKHSFIRTNTYQQYLQRTERRVKHGNLSKLVAGSWVYGTFSTWIGSPDKNRAWDLLCAAKQSFDSAVASNELSDEEKTAAHKQLADCESSDWFWWFGDYNPRESVVRFDKLFRANLSNLYRILRLPVPSQLSEPISYGGGDPEAGGAMRRGEDRRNKTEEVS